MGAAILSDGTTAASRCTPSVVTDAILEPGDKKDFRDPTLLDWAPPNGFKKKKEKEKAAWLPSIGL